jgi:hypothetical protein
LALNGHGSHVKLRVIEPAHEFELDMVNLLFNTSHALQPLWMWIVSNLLKLLLGEKNNVKVRNNHYEPNNLCTLVGWVDKALDRTL